MHYVSVPYNRDSLLLAALVRLGSAAWCFLPADRSLDVLCSDAFLLFWNLPPELNSGLVAHEFSRDSLIQSLGLEGQDSNWLSNPRSDASCDCSCTVHTKIGHGQTVTIRLSPVVAGDDVIGHMACCEAAVDANLSLRLMKEIASAQRKLSVLSPREREILELVYEGRTNKSISIATGISEKTVEKHRAKIMQKLEITCTARMFRLVSKAWLLSDILKPSDSSANGLNGTSPPASPGSPVDSPE